MTAGGKTVYKKGAEVAKNLITGEDGSVTVKNLPLGSYNVTEAQAPENFYNAKETKKVTISYAGRLQKQLSQRLLLQMIVRKQWCR